MLVTYQRESEFYWNKVMDVSRVAAIAHLKSALVFTRDTAGELVAKAAYFEEIADAETFVRAYTASATGVTGGEYLAYIDGKQYFC